MSSSLISILIISGSLGSSGITGISSGISPNNADTLGFCLGTRASGTGSGIGVAGTAGVCAGGTGIFGPVLILDVVDMRDGAACKLEGSDAMGNAVGRTSVGGRNAFG